ncbi:MAG TPA: 2-oxoacid:acceptor oxidoreductase family protein, partial [Burkholderiales bacterium]|nr:2-oxoacid:acceptor oxidoreductase family protein [Burkholderiales bacterium]
SSAQFATELPGYRILPVDGIGISQRHGLGRIVNSALLGAFARALDAPSLESLSRVIREEAPKLERENAAACVEGHRSLGEQLQQAAA